MVWPWSRRAKWTCDIDVLAIRERRVVLNGCHAEHGRVLIKQRPDGGVGINEALLGRFVVPRFDARAPVMEINGVTLSDFDLLLDFKEIALRFDDIELAPSDMRIDNGDKEISLGMLTYQSGRIVMSERMFSLGNGKPNWDYATWEIQRATDPWGAYASLPTPVERGGVLDLPVTAGHLASAEVVRDGFQMEDFVIPQLVG